MLSGQKGLAVTLKLGVAWKPCIGCSCRAACRGSGIMDSTLDDVDTLEIRGCFNQTVSKNAESTLGPTG